MFFVFKKICLLHEFCSVRICPRKRVRTEGSSSLILFHCLSSLIQFEFIFETNKCVSYAHTANSCILVALETTAVTKHGDALNTRIGPTFSIDQERDIAEAIDKHGTQSDIESED